jgi:hypothetical protein
MRIDVLFCTFVEDFSTARRRHHVAILLRHNKRDTQHTQRDDNQWMLTAPREHDIQHFRTSKTNKSQSTVKLSTKKIFS